MERIEAGADLVEQVRSGDYDRFLAIQLAPRAKRAALYAIVAFHVEIATIAEIVSEPLIGHIRLAWWREALEEIEAGKAVRKHPTVEALAEMLRDYPRVLPFLYEMIEARAADLDESLLVEEEAWREYCNHTAGALHMAMAYVLSEACARENESLIRDHGRAYAMIGLARAIPFMAAQGWNRFPKARLEKHHLSSFSPSESLNRFVEEIIADAQQLMASKLHNQRLRVLSVLVALAGLGKRRLMRVSGDPYRLSPAKLPSVWLAIRIHYCSFTCF